MPDQSADEIKSFGDILPGVQYVDRPGAYAFITNARQELAVIQTSFGFFLPGGGLDPGEDEPTALRRELREEIGYELIDALFIVRATQYHWSEFYQSYFRKIGGFYEVAASAPVRETNADGHALLWLPPDRIIMELSQEFQRWAAEKYLLPFA